MRTTIDLPDTLLERLKPQLASRKSTMRAFIIAAIEGELQQDKKKFQLRDASIGSDSAKKVSTAEINAAIDEMRDLHPR